MSKEKVQIGRIKAVMQASATIIKAEKSLKMDAIEQAYYQIKTILEESEDDNEHL